MGVQSDVQEYIVVRGIMMDSMDGGSALHLLALVDIDLAQRYRRGGASLSHMCTILALVFTSSAETAERMTAAYASERPRRTEDIEALTQASKQLYQAAYTEAAPLPQGHVVRTSRGHVLADVTYYLEVEGREVVVVLGPSDMLSCRIGHEVDDKIAMIEKRAGCVLDRAHHDLQSL